jgi:hypothetical protein
MKLDASQSKQRTVLDQISTTSNMRLDDILDLMNDELTPPLRMRVSTETDRVLNIDPIVVQTFHQESTPTARSVGHKRKKTLPPINGQIPNFTGATITFPSASGESITITQGSFGSATYTLTVTPGNYIKVGVLINETGVLSLVFGTAGASEAAATLPDMNTGAFPIGYIVLNNVGGTIQPLISQNIYQFVGGGGSGGGGTSLDRITYEAHGFAVGDILYLNGSTYTKAVASAANTAEVVGVVSKVGSVDTFELTVSGEITGLTGLTAGGVYFLSATTPGLLTLTEPSVVGQISLPVGVASSATTLYVAPKRGVVVGAANARTTISVANNTATNVVNVTNYNSLKLEGELNVTRSPGGNQRAYYTVEAAKNGAGTWQVSTSYTGDDVLYTTLPSWDVASNNLQVTMPLVTNFSSASLTYALNAPAVGASLPLSIDSTALNIVDSAPLSYRNLLINGDMRIAQRGTDANSLNLSGTSGAYVALDRWKFTGYSGAIYDQGRMVKTTITDLSGFNSGMKLVTRFAASQAVVTAQFIESQNSYALAGNQCTLSFYIRKLTTSIDTHALRITVGTLSSVDTTGDIATEASYNNAFDSTRISMANVSTSWTRYTYTFTMPAAATNGVCVRVGVFKGATDIGAFDCIELTGVQLEVGSKATAFERRPYGMELALCQRYLLRYSHDGAGVGGIASGFQTSTTAAAYNLQFPVSMRVKPTFSNLSSSNLLASDQVGFEADATPSSVNAGFNSANIVFSFSANGAQFRPSSLYIKTGTTGFLQFSAEL